MVTYLYVYAVLSSILETPMRCSRNFVIFSFLCFLIGFCMAENQQQVNAQLVPIPPATQGPNATHLEPSQSKNDSPPVIEFLTNSLIEGKNVVKVKITDKSDLKYADIKFVQNGNVVTEGLVRDPNNIYKVLMDAHSPSALIVVTAVDLYGKQASVAKELSVTSLSSSVLGQVSNFFYDVGKIVVSIFAPTKP
jgi:hypothetical protein